MIHAERLVEIHKELWQPRPHAFIIHEGTEHPIEVVDDISRDFRRVIIDRRLIITQNLAKHTENTRWCNEKEHHHMTWVIVDNQYVGQIKSYIGERGHMYEVYRLSPEKLIYQVGEPI